MVPPDHVLRRCQIARFRQIISARSHGSARSSVPDCILHRCAYIDRLGPRACGRGAHAAFSPAFLPTCCVMFVHAGPSCSLPARWSLLCVFHASTWCARCSSAPWAPSTLLMDGAIHPSPTPCTCWQSKFQQNDAVCLHALGSFVHL